MTVAELIDQAHALEPRVFDATALARTRFEAAQAWMDNLAAARALDPQNAHLAQLRERAFRVGSMLLGRWVPGLKLDAPLPAEWDPETRPMAGI